MQAFPLLNPLVLAAGALSFFLACAPGCRTGESSVSEPDAAVEKQAYTAEEVATIRKSSDIDARAFALPGVVSVGIAGSNDDAWIQVLCLDDTLAVQAQQTLGTNIGGVPIRFEVTGRMEAVPPDSSRQQ